MNKIISWAFLVLSLFIAVVAFPLLPDTIACQWDVNGNVSNEVGKWGVFLPTMIIASLAVRNYMGVQNKFATSIQVSRYIYWILMVVLLFAEVYTVLFNLGVKMFLLDIQYINILLGIVFILIGNVLPKVPQNYFLGIKTIWAIQDSEIWTKTQRLGGKIFMLVGALMMVMIFLPQNVRGILTFVGFGVIVIVPFVYGWVLQRQNG